MNIKFKKGDKVRVTKIDEMDVMDGITIGMTGVVLEDDGIPYCQIDGFEGKIPFEQEQLELVVSKRNEARRIQEKKVVPEAEIFGKELFKKGFMQTVKVSQEVEPSMELILAAFTAGFGMGMCDGEGVSHAKSKEIMFEWAKELFV